MGYLGQKQRTDLTRDVGNINKGGGSVSFDGATMDGGADLARCIEGALSSDMSMEVAQNIIDRLQTVAHQMEVFAECRRNPLCKPKPEYKACDVTIDAEGFVEENWH